MVPRDKAINFMTIDFDKYSVFVDAVTSDSSKDFVYLADRLVELDQKGANIERLTTAGVGLAAESGEFLEIVKKMVFQGKPWNDDNREHLIIELGDVTVSYTHLTLPTKRIV